MTRFLRVPAANAVLCIVHDAALYLSGLSKTANENALKHLIPIAVRARALLLQSMHCAHSVPRDNCIRSREQRGYGGVCSRAHR